MNRAHEAAESVDALAAAWRRFVAVGGSPLLVDGGLLGGALEGGAPPPGDPIAAIAALEDLKDAACAAQAELAAAVVRAEVRHAASRPVPEDVDEERVVRRRCAAARRSAIAQVALARRESPHRGGVLVGAAEVLCAEMPHTFTALRTGALNEYRAILLVRETACLDKEARAQVDREICQDVRGLRGVGTRRLVATARKVAYREDPAAVVKRAERAAEERCVTLRPAPEAMTYLTALLPMAQGVAVLAKLGQAAQSARAVGDPRSKGQVMADTLVETITGQRRADDVPIAVNLVMSDATLLASGHEPAVLDGGHMVPAQLARELVANAMDAAERLGAGDAGARVPGAGGVPGGVASAVPGGVASAVPGGPQEMASASVDPPSVRLGPWLRRLYADPGENLVAMDSRARLFPEGLARLLRVRDQGLCRTPWCDAPIAHLDHVVPAVAGGPTSASNGQGLCAGCNLTKEAPGWRHLVTPHEVHHGSQVERGALFAERQEAEDGQFDRTGVAGARLADHGGLPDGHERGHTVVTTTPSGRKYTSTAPPLPAPLRPRARVDQVFASSSDCSVTERFIETMLEHAA